MSDENENHASGEERKISGVNANCSFSKSSKARKRSSDRTTC